MSDSILDVQYFVEQKHSFLERKLSVAQYLAWYFGKSQLRLYKILLGQVFYKLK